MKKLLILIIISIAAVSCRQETEEPMQENQMTKIDTVKMRLEAYAPVKITADLSHLTTRQRILVQKLSEAGAICGQIFWKQSAHDAIPVRDSLMAADGADAETMLHYVNINFGPYDFIYGWERFVGDGPATRPKGGGFYPIDITKQEFETHIKNNPGDEELFKSQYSVILRNEDGSLRAVPYHEYYKEETEQLAAKLEEAADFADNASLKKYLLLRAKAIRNDDYLESDMAWMEIEGNDIDLVIGPIENYEDELFNYKTAHEAVVMVKDPDASAELEMFEKNIQNFEQKLPYDKKYIRESAGKGNILQVVNVVYFGGDCQKGTKTIAASLPNDPRVHAEKGGKKSMYKNMMEAKFEKIVVPISKVMLDPSLHQYVDKKAFTSFVTLHEVSHTLGRGFVYGNDSLPVRQALKERYSAIEEVKADILGLYNHKHLLEMGAIDEEYVKKTLATYIAGLYRSIRFGTESAHGKANVIQLNYMRENGGIIKQEDGTFIYDREKIFDVAAGLANIILTLQAEGDYERAGEVLNKYGQVTEEIKAEIERLKDIPRDIDTSYEF